MKKNIIYLFLATLAPIFSLQSCGLEEPVVAPEGDGYIEFVARPVGFNNQVVQTKADENTVESKIENCFFLVFDAVTGNRVGIHTLNEISWNGSTPQVKLDTKGLQKVIACFLINVPTDFANEIIGTTKPDNAPAGDNNKYLNTAVLSDIIYKSGDDFGFPFIDIDGDDTTDPVACIPMLGVTPTPVDLNTTSISTTIQIPIKRLFAKVSIDLSLQLNLDGWTDIVQRSTYYKLNSYTLCNIPQKVALTSSAEESAWIATPSSFSTTSKGNLSQSIIYNKNGSYSFSFYVPEYYLNSIDNPSSDQRYKPENVKNGTCPIYIKLNGTYTEYSYRAATMEHSIYLGRNNHSDFSIERNTHYTNSLTIKGVTNNADSEAEANIDHRVTTSVIHNPVEIEGESANCYIIAQTGSYSFPAYKGAYKNLTDAALCTGNANSYVEVLAKDNNSITISEPKYDKDNNFISFKVDNIADGNVVIALKNADGSIEWSWHLWCSTSSTIGDWIGNMTGWGEMDPQAYPSGFNLMDRNLGSSSANGAGLYYKYGNKNPYISNGYMGGGSNGSATWLTMDHNNNYVKSINDPCPPGYRVPHKDVWYAEKQNNMVYATGQFTYMPAISLNNVTLDPIYYAYSGYRNASNIVTSVVAPDTFDASTSFTKSDKQYVGDYSDPVDISNELQRRTKTNTDYKYTNFKYQANETNTFGAVYSNNGELLFFEYTNLTLSSQTSITIVSCLCTATQTVETQERTLWRTVMGQKIWNTWKDKGSTTTTSTYTLYEHDDFDNLVWLGELFALESARNLASGDYGFKSLNGNDDRFKSQYGYQVRCVKE